MKMKIGLCVVNAVLACILLVAVFLVVESRTYDLHPRIVFLLPVAMTALIAVTNAIMFIRVRKEMSDDLMYFTKRIAELEKKLNVEQLLQKPGLE